MFSERILGIQPNPYAYEGREQDCFMVEFVNDL